MIITDNEIITKEIRELDYKLTLFPGTIIVDNVINCCDDNDFEDCFNCQNTVYCFKENQEDTPYYDHT